MGDQPTDDRPTSERATTDDRPATDDRLATDDPAITDSPTGRPPAEGWATNDAALLPEATELEYDDTDDSYRLQLDGTHKSVSVAVVGAVAAVAGTDPLELRPLRESVDSDALDDLFARTCGGTSRESGRIEFLFEGYRVVVNATGEVEIHPTE